MPRKEKKYHFIYKTTNLITGRYYYGMHSTDDLDDGYFGSGRRLRRSINKYGEENHKREIVEYCENRYKLSEREKEIIVDAKKHNECMNLFPGGYGGFHSVEQQEFRSSCAGKAASLKRKNDVAAREKFRKIQSDRMKELHECGKIKLPDWVGKKHSKKSIEKMKISHVGKHVGNLNSQFGTRWITNGVENKKILKTGIIPKNWYAGRISQTL